MLKWISHFAFNVNTKDITASYWCGCCVYIASEWINQSFISAMAFYMRNTNTGADILCFVYYLCYIGFSNTFSLLNTTAVPRKVFTRGNTWNLLFLFSTNYSRKELMVANLFSISTDGKYQIISHNTPPSYLPMQLIKLQ